jgi:hypothetical protein
VIADVEGVLGDACEVVVRVEEGAGVAWGEEIATAEMVVAWIALVEVAEAAVVVTVAVVVVARAVEGGVAAETAAVEVFVRVGEAFGAVLWVFAPVGVVIVVESVVTARVVLVRIARGEEELARLHAEKEWMMGSGVVMGVIALGKAAQEVVPQVLKRVAAQWVGIVRVGFSCLFLYLHSFPLTHWRVEEDWGEMWN